MPYWPEGLAVSIRFFVFFFGLPALLVPGKATLLDRLMIGFTFTAGSSVLLGQTLAAMQVYEPIGLWGSTILIGVFWIYRRIDLQETWMRKWMRSLDWLEDNQKRVAERLHQFRAQLNGLIRSIPGLLRHPDFPTWLLGLAVIGWSAWLRYLPYLEHAYLGASDGYTHLLWTKLIEDQQLFGEGIYPRGYHAILSVFGMLTFLDRMVIIRFVGPIGGLLLVISVGYAGVKLRLRPSVVVVAMALFGLSFGSPLPANPWRQTQPLPQEFAAIFVLPGLLFAWEHLRTGGRMALGLLLMSIFLTTSIHTYSLVYLSFAVALLAVAAWASGRVPFRRLLTLAVLSAGATLAATAPMLIATVMGLPWHGSLGYVTGQVQSLDPSVGLSRIISGNPYLDGGLLLGLLLTVAGGVAIRRREELRAPMILATGLMLILLFTQTHGRTGIPVLMDKERSGLFFSLFLMLGIGIALNWLLDRFPLSRRLQAGLAAGLIALPLALWWPAPVRTVPYEYDEAVDLYLQISREFPRLEWTIVSPVEQYSQVLGVGYHENLTDFLARVDKEQVKGRDFKLHLPTPDVLVYVEKVPLGSQEPVLPDPDVRLEPEGLTGNALVLRFYREPDGRRLLQQRIWGVMEAYMNARPQEVRIYYDSPVFRVYHIHHDVKQK